MFIVYQFDLAIYLKETKQNGFVNKEKVTNLNSHKKMKPHNIFGLIIYLAFKSNMIISSCFQQSDSKIQRPFSPWEVAIWNHRKDSTLLAHCKSKDNDLG